MFRGVERLAVSVVSGEEGSAFEPVELAVCDVTAGCDVSADELILTTNTEDDLLPLLQEESIELAVEVVARPTVQTYLLDVDVCMGAQASVALAP